MVQILASTSPLSRHTGEVSPAAMAQPTAPASIGRTQCQNRSLLRSAWRVHSGIVQIAAIDGTAVMRPIIQ